MTSEGTDGSSSVTPVDLGDALAGLAFLLDPTTAPALDAPEPSFVRLGELEGRGLFVSTFAGDTPWERHRADELLLILEGEATLVVLADGQERPTRLAQGQFLVVPEDTWHRFETPGIRILGLTPQPTETCPLDQRPG
ncbi:MAG: cupin domain-containing protein [Actinomycetota bacterium]